MSETTFTFRVDHELKIAFADAAKGRDRTGAQLLRDYMREIVRGERDVRDHDRWFREEIARSLREATDPKVGRISDEEVRASWREERAELLARTAGKSP